MFKSVLVSGASGFVGENLVHHLFKQGYRVTCLVRESTNKARLEAISPQVSFGLYDGSYKSAQRIFERTKYETVFHLATLAKYDHDPEDICDMIRSNIVLGTHLAEAMTEFKVKNLINACTFWQYYHSHDYQPLNLYAATKQALVDILKYYSLNHDIWVANVILFDTYGPNDPRTKLPSLILDASEEQREINLSPGEQLIDLTHVSDVVTALERAVERINARTEKFNTYIASNGNPETLKLAITNLAKQNGVKYKLNWGKKPYREKEVFHIDIYDRFENLLRNDCGKT